MENQIKEENEKYLNDVKDIKNNNDEQLKNILFILTTLFIFHFDISGNIFKDEQFSKSELISLTFSVFHEDISGNSCKDVQL